VKEAVAGAVGLYPFAVDDELRDGALADIGEDEVRGASISISWKGMLCELRKRFASRQSRHQEAE
jgi:hypothetical protein